MSVEAANIKIRIDTDAKKATADMKGLNKATSDTTKGFGSMKSVGDALVKIGLAKLFADLTVNLVKLASNAEETANKFGVVFSSISKNADTAAKNLSSSFGLSTQAAEALLSNTGDLLTGFGFTQEAALDLSEQVNVLAADLASFTNFQGGTQGASEALTKALLGETESAKSLGIVIRQNTKEFREEVKAIQAATGATEQQARSQAIFNQIVSQSQNAIGDFARSQDSFANQSRILDAAIEDLGTELGEVLLPFATELIKTFKNVIDVFDSMDKEMLAITLVIGGVVAAIIALQSALQAVGLTLAGPAGIVALLVAGAAALFGFAANAKAVRDAELEETFSGIAEQMGITAQEAVNLNDEIATLNARAAEIKQFEGSLQPLINDFEEIAENAGLTTDELFNILDASEDVNDVTKELLEGYREEAKLNRLANEAEQERNNLVQERLAIRQAERDAILAEQTSMQALIDAEAMALDVLGQRLRALDALYSQGAITEQQAKERALELTEEQIDRLISLGEVQGSLTAAQLNSLAVATEALERYKQGLAELQEIREQEIETIEAVKEVQLTSDEEILQSLARIRELREEAHQERLDQIREETKLAIDTSQQVLNSLSSVISNLQNQELERLQAEVDATEEGSEAREKAEERLNKAKKKFAREQAIREKALGLFNVAIDTAQAIVAFLAEGNIPGSIAAGVTGAAQAAVIASTPIPEAAMGGSFTVPPGAERDGAMVRVESGERLDVTPASESGFANGKNFILKIGDREFTAFLQDEINSGDITINRPEIIRT
jgi:hypothetical protein